MFCSPFTVSCTATEPVPALRLMAQSARHVGVIEGKAAGGSALGATTSPKVAAWAATAPPARPAIAMAATASRFLLFLIPITVPSRREAGVVWMVIWFIVFVPISRKPGRRSRRLDDLAAPWVARP